MWNNRHLIWIFYRPILVINLMFSLGAMRLLFLAGWGFILIVLSIKLSGYLAVAGYQYLMSQNVFYYYRNAGISMRTLYLQTFTLDFFIFIPMLIFYYIVS